MKYRVTPDSSEKNDESANSFVLSSLSSGETSSISSSSSTKSFNKIKRRAKKCTSIIVKKNKKLIYHFLFKFNFFFFKVNTKESTFEYNNTTTRVENFEEYKEFRTINSTLKQVILDFFFQI